MKIKSAKMIAIAICFMVPIYILSTPNMIRDQYINQLTMKYLWTRITPYTNELNPLKSQINEASIIVDNTRQTKTLAYSLTKSDVLIVAPPYYNISDLNLDKLVDKSTIEWINKELMTTETGQLFLIRDGQLVDHQTLSFLISPVANIMTGGGLKIEILANPLSGRPLTLKIE